MSCQHDYGGPYGERGFECRNGCGSALISRGAVLLVTPRGRTVPRGVRWFCYRHRGRRVAGRIFPTAERERALRLLRRHEREVHRAMRQELPREQLRLGEVRLRARGAR